MLREPSAAKGLAESNQMETRFIISLHDNLEKLLIEHLNQINRKVNSLHDNLEKLLIEH
jgi:hypothetical protein